VTKGEKKGWVGFFIALGGVAGLALLQRKSSSGPSARLLPAPPVLDKTPRVFKGSAKVYAYIYRRRNETEYRMAVGTSYARPREMGIFDSVEAAQKVARDKGFTLAWKGARDE
jgi:hypothetical protein